MAKKERSLDETAKKALIEQKIEELKVLIYDYFSDFIKVTNGQKGVGMLSLDFITICYENVDKYPEILSATYNVADFKAKASALIDLFGFVKAMNDTTSSSNDNIKFCKADAMSYANEYYYIIKKEGARDNKYKPLLDKLVPFYKKSKAEKTDDGKGTDGATNKTTK